MCSGGGESDCGRGTGHISGRKIELLILHRRFKEELILNYLFLFIKVADDPSRMLAWSILEEYKSQEFLDMALESELTGWRSDISLLTFESPSISYKIKASQAGGIN